MAILFPTPHLTKLPPVPSWSMRPLAPSSADLAPTPKRPVVMVAGLAATPAPWGTCEIVLVAERMRGATHKFFHDWRFEAVMRQGEPAPGTVLAAVSITPRRQTVAGPIAPVSVALQDHAAAPNAETPLRETFAWTAPAHGVAPDLNQPLVLALARLRQQLRDAGWQPSAASATRYHKAAPDGRAAGAARTPAPARADLEIATKGTSHDAV